MTHVNIEVPAELHTKLKLRAVRDNKTIQQVLIEVLQRRKRR